MLPAEIRDEVTPKNILMMGPTGVGKTEIARRLAKLVDAPFVKVEATKFTEVGYVGRDVDSIIRDLVEAAIRVAKEKQAELVHDKAVAAAEDRLVQLIVKPQKKPTNPIDILLGTKPASPRARPRKSRSIRPSATRCAPSCARANWSTSWSRSRSRSSSPRARYPAPTST